MDMDMDMLWCRRLWCGLASRDWNSVSEVEATPTPALAGAVIYCSLLNTTVYCSALYFSLLYTSVYCIALYSTLLYNIVYCYYCTSLLFMQLRSALCFIRSDRISRHPILGILCWCESGQFQILLPISSYPSIQVNLGIFG